MACQTLRPPTDALKSPHAESVALEEALFRVLVIGEDLTNGSGSGF